MSKMKKWELTCEVIIPMFLYGADQDRPEIRAASIRGVMRYWWRAVQAESGIGAKTSAGYGYMTRVN